MKYEKPNPTLCNNGFMLSPAALDKALVLAGMTWGMPPAQVYAMHLWSLMNSELHKQTKTTDYMLGIPIEIDKDLPNSVVQLRWKGAVIFTIENLALPTGFEENTPA